MKTKMRKEETISKSLVGIKLNVGKHNNTNRIMCKAHTAHTHLPSLCEFSFVLPIFVVSSGFLNILYLNPCEKNSHKI